MAPPLPDDPDLGTSPLQAVALAGSIYVMGGGPGGLIRIAFDQDQRTVISRQGVRALAVLGQDVFTLRLRTTQADRGRVVSQVVSDRLVDLPPLPPEMDGASLLGTVGDRLLVVAEKAFALRSAEGWEVKAFKGKHRDWVGMPSIAAPQDGTAFYLASSYGGLERIALADGKVQPIKTRGRMMKIIPNTSRADCVTGAEAREEPGTVAGKPGFVVDGRIVAICGTRVQTIFEKPMPPPPPDNPYYDPAHALVAFWDLARDRSGTAWATSRLGLYEIKGGEGTQHKLAKPRLVGGLAVDRSIPGLVMLYMRPEAAQEVRSAVPMLISER